MSREFTEADVINGHIYCDKADLSFCPLSWQSRGLQQTATGYGATLTTPYKIRFDGKLYRIYATCYSNAASCWFTARGRKIYVA